MPFFSAFTWTLVGFFGFCFMILLVYVAVYAIATKAIMDSSLADRGDLMYLESALYKEIYALQDKKKEIKRRKKK